MLFSVTMTAAETIPPFLTEEGEGFFFGKACIGMDGEKKISESRKWVLIFWEKWYIVVLALKEREC